MAHAFASRVEASVTSIRRDTKISTEGRAGLDPLLVTIDLSAQAIAAGGDSIRQMDALFAMTRALDTYGQIFDDPDWKPVQER